ncbi:Ca-activated chloride channel family protein [Chitinophaga skermanii]|uniref:Ca-activated chloride channel family protein n=1 Tax=Chitinophaga skermanii TaxID=331697 RepID=A0A327QDP0_9BACT|nr:VWA domain-containing protein [Chitinophaga skermanii]RAJ02431.1 Ca-activated chloride channel family protein [Chitinophaga skermanii]
MQFEIAYKWVFFLLPLPLLVYLLLPPMHRKRLSLLAPFFDRAKQVSGQRAKRSAWVSRRNFFTWLGLMLCWLCLLGAASMPQYVGKPGKKAKTVRSFLIVADISFSMDQTDWLVRGQRMSRWNAVKSLMKDFVAKRKSDQIGLVVFGSDAYLQAPLTTDLSTITWLLDQTAVGMAGQMTNIGDAIAFSSNILKADTIKQKIMFLLTDGVDTGTELAPVDAANVAHKDSITIYTMGIGKATGTGGYDLDERTLRDVAQATGGQYFNAMNEGDMTNVYKTLDKLTPVVYEEESYRPTQLLYYYPLLAAVLIALLVQFIMGTIHLTRLKGAL